jgi:peptidoglycan/LPS O-acetylase OafA/YrhL
MWKRRMRLDLRKPAGVNADVKRFETLQAFRGAAALAVMLMHCATMQGGLSAAQSNPAFYLITRILASGGGAGVDAFFVISGVVITQVGLKRAEEQGRLGASAGFLLRRVLRVFPLYWVTLAATAGLAAAYGYVGPDLRRVLSFSVLTLFTDTIPFLAPAWTLAFEIWFYAGTALLILLLPRRHFLAGLGAWAGVQSCVLIVPWLARHVPDFYAFRQPQLLDFFLGCGIAALVHRFPGDQGKLPRVAMTMSAFGFLTGCVICFGKLPTGSLWHWQRLIFYGLPASLLLYGIVVLERQNKISAPNWLRRLGDWSYSIYLWHYPVMSLTFVLSSWYATFPLGSPLLHAALNAALTVAIAPLSFRFIETPFITLASSRRQAMAVKQQAAA